MARSAGLSFWLVGLLVAAAACGGSSSGSSERAVTAPLPSADKWMWPETSMLGIELDLDATVASRWLPAPLKLADPPTATVFVAAYPNSACCGPYFEAAVLFHVVHDGVEKLHCAWMVVDDDVALVLGREVLGFPKKMAEISLEVGKGRLRALVEREGTTLIDAAGVLGEPVAAPAPLLGGDVVNVWGPYMPYIASAPLPRLLSLGIREEILSAVGVDLDVAVSGSVGDPLDELGLRSVRRATLYGTNMTGGGTLALGGEVDRGYLAVTYQLRTGNVLSLPQSRP